MPIKVAASEPTCALDAAMFAAVAAGIYGSVIDAQAKIGSGFSGTYTPDPANAKVYDRLYEKYLQLGNTLEQQLREL